MKVRVRLLGIFEVLPFSEGKKEIQVDVEGTTLKDLLHQLFMNINETSKGTVFNILNNQGEISPNLSITINGRSVSDSDSLNKELKESDYIELFSASGGWCGWDLGGQVGWYRKLQAPIGLDIGGEIPEEIAISIAAEIISAKKGKLETLKKKGEGKVLLDEYQLRIVLPDCNFSAETVNAIVTLSEDISEVLPYLNSVLKGLQYIDKNKILTVKKGGHLITFRPREIAITKLEDEKEARQVMEELKQIINETYQKRDKVKPDYTMPKELKSSDILKLLPGTNCKECGERTCFSFSFKLIRHEVEISKCTPLFLKEYEEKRKVLLKQLDASGYEVPSAKKWGKDGR